MNNIFNEDFQQFIKALNDNEVKYVLVGGYSVILHGYHRVTGDLDLFIEPSETNFERLLQAFRVFGLPTNAIAKNDFINNKDVDVFTFGRPPVAIDLMTKLANFTFEEVYSKTSLIDCDSLQVRLIHINHLREAKKFANRHKDLDDLEHLL